MNLVGYTRCSTREQGDSGLGMGAQLQSITDFCRRHNHRFTIASDVASAARVDSRPGLVGALELLRSGALDGLIVAKLDRLSRSMFDFVGILREAEKYGWKLIIVDLGIDTFTPTGRLVAGILMQVAEWERGMISLRTKEALGELRAQGKSTGGKPPMPVDERAIALIRSGRQPRGGEEMLSWSQIALALTEDGVPTPGGRASWQALQVQRVAARIGIHSPVQVRHQLEAARDAS